MLNALDRAQNVNIEAFAAAGYLNRMSRIALGKGHSKQMRQAAVRAEECKSR